MKSRVLAAEQGRFKKRMKGTRTALSAFAADFWENRADMAVRVPSRLRPVRRPDACEFGLRQRHSLTTVGGQTMSLRLL